MHKVKLFFLSFFLISSCVMYAPTKKSNKRFTSDQGLVQVFYHISKGLNIRVVCQKENESPKEYGYEIMNYKNSLPTYFQDVTLYKMIDNRPWIAVIENNSEVVPANYICLPKSERDFTMIRWEQIYKGGDFEPIDEKDVEILKLGFELMKEESVFEQFPEYFCKEFYEIEKVTGFVKPLH